MHRATPDALNIAFATTAKAVEARNNIRHVGDYAIVSIERSDAERPNGAAYQSGWEIRHWPMPQSRDTYRTAWLMAAAVVLLGVGLTDINPNGATVTVLAAFATASAAIFTRRELPFTSDGGAVVRVLGAGIILEGYVLAMRPVLENAGYQILVFGLCLVAAHATVMATRWRRTEVAVVFVAYFVGMCWMLAATNPPPSDVILVQQEASATLLDGLNPYSMRFENIYGQGTSYYAPELQVGDQLAFGFMYPPLSLLLAIPGYVITGDFRYGALFAVTLTATLAAIARPGAIATGAAFLILFAPVTQLVLYWGWSEPFVVLPLAATAYLAARSSSSTPIALGLLISAKQFTLPVLLIGFVLLRTLRLRLGPTRIVLVPVGIALATIIPFAIWNLPALVHSAVTSHLLMPFRLDAITIPALLARFQLPPTPPLLGYVLGAVTLVVLLRGAPRTVAGFCFTTAVSLMVFFLFNKYAFMNYYYFVLVALACGIATTSASIRDAS